MLTRMVDGVEVVCSAAEESAIRAEWAANEAAQAAAAAKAASATAADSIINDPKAIAALKAALAK